MSTLEAPPETAAPTYTIGGDDITIEPFSAYKALKVLGIVRAIAKDGDKIGDELREYRRKYERENVQELPRSQALFQFGPGPLEDPDRPGHLLRDDDGQPMMGPHPLAHLTDADWAKSGEKLHLPQSPSTTEEIWAMFDAAYEAAHERIVQLVALALAENSKLEEWHDAGGDDHVDKEIKEHATRLLFKASGDEFMMVVAYAVDVAVEQFSASALEIKSRAGKLQGLLGRTPAPQATPTPQPAADSPEEGTSSATPEEGSPTEPTSSTDTPPPTGGDQDGSSTASSGDSSSPSEPG